MNKYESIVVLDGQLEAERVKSLVEKISDVITSNSGIVDSIDEWGKKRLAYPIKDLTEGFYVLFNYQAPAELPIELERNLKIMEEVLRYITVKKD
ncbi:MAG TPA: 30S ribosomal protein S6 [Clostridia bacterium]|nr:30S ribosomal protein S6 [Clostridia bacterium]